MSIGSYRLTNALRFICLQYGVQIINYLDDFAGADTWDTADTAHKTVQNILSGLGFQEVADKACSPSTQMEFLGTEFRTDSMTLHVTEARLRDITAELRRWLCKTSANKVELQSLIGKLLFVAKCVRPGRFFLGRLLEWLRELPDRGKHPRFHMNKRRTYGGGLDS